MKKAVFVILGLIMALGKIAVAEDSGLVGYWVFDKNQKVVKDRSGLGNDGRMVIMGKLVKGEFGTGIEFSCRPRIGCTRVAIPYSKSLDLTREITIEVLIYPKKTETGSGKTIVFNLFILGKRKRGGYSLCILDKTLTAHFGTDNGYDVLRSESKIEVNKWYHIIVTRKGNMGKIYINGRLDAIKKWPTDSWNPSPVGLTIGKGWFKNPYFEGIIQSVKIYNRALTAEEIEKEFNKSKIAKTFNNTGENKPKKKENYLIWLKSPMSRLSLLDLPPVSVKEATEINISAAINEYEPASFVLTNISSSAIRGRIIIGKLVNEQKKLFPLEKIEIRLPSFVRASNPYLGLKPTKEVGKLADPLPLANEANEFILPPGESQEVWLGVNTKGVSPGLYKGTLFIRPHYGASEKKLALNIKVYPIKLPDEMPIVVFMYAEVFNILDSKLNGREDKLDVLQKYYNDLVSHRVNTFFLCSWAKDVPYMLCTKEGEVIEPLEKKRLAKFDWWLNFYSRNARLLVMNICDCKHSLFKLQNGENAEKHGVAFLSPKWNKLFKIWFSALLKHFKDVGVYDKVVFYSPYDEITPKYVNNAIKIIKLMKEVDPKVKIYQTYSWAGSNTETIKATLPYVDIAVPRIMPSRLVKKGSFPRGKQWQLFVDAKNKYNKKIWGYNCWAAKWWSPWEFRTLVWTAYRFDMDGVGSWTYSPCMKKGSSFDCSGDSWNDFDGRRIDLGLVYDTLEYPTGPIPSRRWMGFTQGLEDYLYLYLLKDMVKKAKAKNINVSEGESLLKEFDEEIFYVYSKGFYEFREKVLKTLADLHSTITGKKQ